MGQRIPPTEQNQLIGWLADYFKTPPVVFREMTEDRRWILYQRVCDKILYPCADGAARRVVYN